MSRLPLLVATVVAALALTAPAAHAITDWCSESGDSCYATYKYRGIRYVAVNFAAKYKEKQTVCVVAPTGAKDCVTRRLKAGDGDTYGVVLRWSTTFPNRGKGTYTLESPAPKPITFRVR